jgi:hypothetical protein
MENSQQKIDKEKKTTHFFIASCDSFNIDGGLQLQNDQQNSIKVDDITNISNINFSIKGGHKCKQ